MLMRGLVSLGVPHGNHMRSLPLTLFPGGLPLVLKCLKCPSHPLTLCPNPRARQVAYLSSSHTSNGTRRPNMAGGLPLVLPHLIWHAPP
eukprot:5869111-Prymnesium_polylepis.1